MTTPALKPTDQLQRFYFAHSGIRGFWVNLNGVLDELASRREYPAPITALMGEMLAAAAMVADGLKWPGSVALQAKMPGTLRTLMAEYRPPSGLRAIARAADASFAETDFSQLSQRDLLKDGQLAVSLLPTEEQPQVQPYQGLVALSDGNLAANLESYFANSEQLPTLFALAADPSDSTGADGVGNRAVGLLLQKLPNNAQDPWDEDIETIAWARLQAQLADLGSATLLETASLGTPEALLRSFVAIDDVKLAPPRPLQFACTCNREKTAQILRTVPKNELVALLEEQEEIEVTCEFCGQIYAYTALDTHLLKTPEEDLPKH